MSKSIGKLRKSKMNYKGPGISTYWGDDEYSDRKAIVMKNSEGFYVEFWKADVIVERRTAYEHSESYAEDVAKNWCLGYMP